MAVNDDACDVICTAHTAKGLEWDQVSLEGFVDLQDAHEKITTAKHQEGRERGMTVQEFQQELNLYYVAVTRARYLLDDASPNERVYKNRIVAKINAPTALVK